jgi:hypothetical protein
MSVWISNEEAEMLARAAQMVARWEHENAKPEERMGGEVEFYRRERQYLALANKLDPTRE